MANVLERFLRLGEGRTLRKLSSLATAVNHLEDEFAHLSDDDRKAIREILAETVKRPSFPSADSQAPSAEASLR